MKQARVTGSTVTKESVTVVIDGKTHSIKAGDPNFERVAKAVRAEGWDDVVKFVAKGDHLAKLTQGLFTFENNHLKFRGEPVDPDVSKKIYEMATRGDDPTPMMRFWKRLQANPSWRSVQQLWKFLNNKGIPIGRDGRIIAFKGVQNDYMDAHSGKFSNRPGNFLKMDRNKVSDDPRQHCHYGFHIGSKSFASHYGRLVVVAIDPADVVCIPDDSPEKMRVCAYQVLKDDDGKPIPDDVWEDYSLDAAPRRLIEDHGSQETGPKPTAIRKLKPSETPVAKVLVENELDIRTLSLADLRKYAKEKGVKNPSKIPGGKPKLMEAIIKTFAAQKMPAAVTKTPKKKVDYMAAVHDRVRSGDKIGAIKILRDHEALTLKEAKERVDTLDVQMGPKKAAPAKKVEAKPADKSNAAIQALKDRSLKDLRTLAARLGITGASKLAGGKPALLKKIVAHYKKSHAKKG